MRMLGIKCVRSILPNISMQKPSRSNFIASSLSSIPAFYIPCPAADFRNSLPLLPSLPLLVSSPYFNHHNAPSAWMEADAERARRLQERRSLFCPRRQDWKFRRKAALLTCRSAVAEAASHRGLHGLAGLLARCNRPAL